MPRRGNVAKREVLADPIYNSKVVTRLVNYIMLDGKKGVAQEIVYDAFNIVKEKTGNDPLDWLLRSSTPPTVSAALSRSARIRTRWPRPTRLLPTIVIDSLSRRYKPWLRREMYLCK